MYTLSLTRNEYIYGMQYYFTRFQNHESVAIFYFILFYLYCSTTCVKILTRILARLTRMARTVTRMTRMARWLAH